MELLNLATDWAKAEVFSTRFFILFAAVFLLASVGFWQLGKTDLAKAYVIPTLVAGILLMTIGLGLFFTNKSRITAFEKAYNEDKNEFYQSEIDRSESTLKEYKIVLKVVPILIIMSALVVIFINTPLWRAIGITTVALMVIILLVDGTAHARIEAYHKALQAIRE